MIDMDNLKKINDTHGHDEGDHALRRIAQSFHALIRKQDLVGRWGGDEFLVILSEATLTDAFHLAERLRKGISKISYNHAKNIMDITVSIGIASSNGQNAIEETLKNADEALYAAKKTKNTVCIGNNDQAGTA